MIYGTDFLLYLPSLTQRSRPAASAFAVYFSFNQLLYSVFSSHEAPAAAAAFVLATDYAAADGVTDAADALQRCIDENPHRTIFFPDGEYLLSHPIATPADPARAVTLRLSDFAFLKAAPDWAHTNAMVRLGARAPANNNRAPGSVYGLYGGNIDGAGRATGIAIESGRETRVQNVAIKRCHVGIHVWKGANSGSADCDVRDVDMTGNNEPGSVGLLVEAHDNTFTNFRMVDFQTGVVAKGSGNLMTNLHPLLFRPRPAAHRNPVRGGVPRARGRPLGGVPRHEGDQCRPARRRSGRPRRPPRPPPPGGSPQRRGRRLPRPPQGRDPSVTRIAGRGM